jgi:hypothetical protein
LHGSTPVPPKRFILIFGQPAALGIQETKVKLRFDIPLLSEGM